MFTPEILERYGYNRFEWNNGTIVEYWKSLGSHPDDFNTRICVRFGEFRNIEYAVYLVFTHSMRRCKNISTIEKLEQLVSLLSNEEPTE